MALYSAPRPAGFRALPSGLLTLDDRSGELIVAGKYQMALPTTDAELVAQGWPSILGAVDGDLWLCDEGAGNLVGEINGYALAPQNAPLQGRLFNGLPYGGNLWSKAAVETPGASLGRFIGANNAILDVDASDFTVSFLIRAPAVQPPATDQSILDKCPGVVGWRVRVRGGINILTMGSVADGVGTYIACPATIYDGALHLFTLSIDRDGNVSFYLDDAVTVAAACINPASITVANTATFMNWIGGGHTFGGQCSWFYFCIGVAASRVGHDALWAALSSDWLGTDNTYARANPLTYRISNVMGYVATAGANQFMPGYNANASAADNPLKTGVVCEDGATFLGLGTTNMGVWRNGDGGYIWNANQTSGDNTKSVAATGALVGTYGAIVSPNGVCSDGTYVYVTDVTAGAAGTLYKYNLATGALVTSWSVTDFGRWVCFDGTNLYATAAVIGGGTLRQFSTAGVAGFVTAIGNNPWECCYDGLGYVWTTGYASNDVCKVRCSDGSLIGTYATGVGPYSCCADGTNIWIANRGASTVTKLLQATGALVGTYAVGNTPYGICFDGTYIYTADGGAGTVTKLLASTGAFVATFAGFGNCYKIATDGTYLYVGLQNPTNVVRKVRCSDGLLIGDSAVGTDPGGVCLTNIVLPIPAGGPAATYPTTVDGPSGMRDAIRVADTSAININFAESPVATLAGATNVPFIFSAYVKSGGVGTNAVYQSFYTGDAGGAEIFTNWTIAGAVGAAWRPFIGLAHTPTGAAHTGVVVRLYPTDAAAASLGTVDFAEVWGVQNSAIDRLAWRRVAAGAGAATGTPTLSYTNVGNGRYNPARGRIKVRVVGFQNPASGGESIVICGGGGAPGALLFDRSGGNVRLRMWDTAGAWVVDVLSSPIAVATEYNFVVEWNAAAGTASIMNGATVMGSVVVAPWVPEPLDVTPIAVGSAGAANAARAHVILVEFYNF